MSSPFDSGGDDGNQLFNFGKRTPKKEQGTLGVPKRSSSTPVNKESPTGALDSNSICFDLYSSVPHHTLWYAPITSNPTIGQKSWGPETCSDAQKRLITDAFASVMEKICGCLQNLNVNLCTNGLHNVCDKGDLIECIWGMWNADAVNIDCSCPNDTDHPSEADTSHKPYLIQLCMDQLDVTGHFTLRETLLHELIHCCGGWTCPKLVDTQLGCILGMHNQHEYGTQEQVRRDV